METTTPSVRQIQAAAAALGDNEVARITIGRGLSSCSPEQAAALVAAALRRGDDRTRLAGDWPTKAYQDAAGVWRWRSNDHVPPAEVIATAVDLALIDQDSADRSNTARKADTAAALAAYRDAQSRRTPAEIAAERAEMLAAFGPGASVTNVVTGARTQL